MRDRLDGSRLGAEAAPRGHDSHGDLSRDDVMAAPRSRDSHHDMSSALGEIEARIEHEIVALAPLVHERARLLHARAAILGEPEPEPIIRAASPLPRLTREAVFEYLTRNPGSRAG